jgi:hypothetical protein
MAEHIDSLGLDFVAIQFAPNITHQDRPMLEQEAAFYYAQHNPLASEIYVGIKSTQIIDPETNATDLLYAPDESIYFPIHYMHPLEHNEEAVDVDLYST